MRPITVRFGHALWELIEEEANHDNVSAAHWIRDACLSRALWEQQRRGIHTGPDVLDLIREERLVEDRAMEEVVRDVLATSPEELHTIISRLPPDSATWLRRTYGL